MNHEHESQSKLWIVCTVIGFICWAHYGIGAKFSSEGYHHASELTFFWVCAVYAVLGTGLALALIKIQNDTAAFPARAKLWSAIAGLVGAGGAVCVIKAMKVGNPLFVMPLVFGPAQAFNALFTKLLQGFKNRPNKWFWVGLVGLVAFSFMVQTLKGGGGVDTVEKIQGGSWLIWTLMAAGCWGMYGVASRLSVMESSKASKGHGSHLKVLLGVSLVYALFGLGTWLFGATGLAKPITGETLFESNPGIYFGIFTGLVGLGGAAMVIPANSVAGSPGPIVVMAIVFMGAAGVNAVASILWEWAYKGTDPHVTVPFVVSLAGLAVSGLIFSLNSPNRPAKPAAAAPPEPQVASGR